MISPFFHCLDIHMCDTSDVVILVSYITNRAVNLAYTRKHGRGVAAACLIFPVVIL